MAAMFLLRVDSFTDEARRSRRHVLLPLYRLQSAWPGLTLNEVRALRGSPVPIYDEGERKRGGVVKSWQSYFH